MSSRQERFSHALQFEVAHTCLEAIGRTGGFALAGSGAIREHELIKSPKPGDLIEVDFTGGSG